jgi:hypothetical protein
VSWSRVTDALSGWAPLTAATTCALFDTLVGVPQAVTIDATRLPAGAIRHPYLLGTLLRLLSCASPDVATLALSHLHMLCRAAPDNCAALIQVGGWQRLLLRACLRHADGVGADYRSVSSGDVGGRAVSGSLLGVVMSLLAEVHAHALLRADGGWRHLHHSLAEVRLLAVAMTDEEGLRPADEADSASTGLWTDLGRASEVNEPAEVAELGTPAAARPLVRTLLLDALSVVTARLPNVVEARRVPPAPPAQPGRCVWSRNVEVLLILASRFLFDEPRAIARSGHPHAHHSTCHGPPPRLPPGPPPDVLPSLPADGLLAAPGEPSNESPEGASSAPHDAAWSITPVDSAVGNAVLDLLHMLGTITSASPPSPSWSAVRAVWYAHCDMPPRDCFKDMRNGRTTPRTHQPNHRPGCDTMRLAMPHHDGRADPPPNADGAEGPLEAPAELSGGVYWLALRLLLEMYATQTPNGGGVGGCVGGNVGDGMGAFAGARATYLSWLVRLVALLQPSSHAAHPKAVGSSASAARRQRLHALCGAWQATALERRSKSLTPPAAGGEIAAPTQGVLLYALARVCALVEDGADSTHDDDRLGGVAVALLRALEPCPFARQVCHRCLPIPSIRLCTRTHTRPCPLFDVSLRPQGRPRHFHL